MACRLGRPRRLWLRFWLAERGDMGHLKTTVAPPVWVQVTPAGNWRLLSLNGRSGRVRDFETPDVTTGLVAARQE